MVALAKHEETESMIIADIHTSAVEIRDKYPGKLVCYFCDCELFPVKAGFRRTLYGNLEIEVFHRTHFRHAAGGSEHCLSYRGQSLEHILPLEFWQKKLVTASRTHFKSQITTVYEPLLKTIDITRRPDLGLIYRGNMIGGCEVQMSKISERQIFARSNDHLALGMAGSWWGLNGKSFEVECYLRQYGIAYTIQLERLTEYQAVHHPMFGDNYLYPIDTVKNPNLTVWQPGERTDTIVPDDFYAQFIESAIKGDRSFPCHNKYVDLPPLEKKRVQGEGKKILIALSDLMKEGVDLKGVELRDSDSNLIGVLKTIVDEDAAVVLTPKGETLLLLNCLYVDKNIIDECLKTEEQNRKEQVIAAHLKDSIREIRAELIQNSVGISEKASVASEERQLKLFAPSNLDELSKLSTTIKNVLSAGQKRMVGSLDEFQQPEVGHVVKILSTGEYGTLQCVRGYGSRAIAEVKTSGEFLRCVPFCDVV